MSVSHRTKVCFRCDKEKPVEDFYVHKQMADGRLGKCKDCTKADSRNNYFQLLSSPVRHAAEKARQRAKQRIYEAMNPKKVLARRAVKYAIRRGTMKRGHCKVCNSPNAQAHHDDYDKPLEVIWFCRKHHAEHHSA